MAQVQKLRGEAAQIDYDRRANTEPTAAPPPIEFGATAAAHDYPPAAVTALFIAEMLSIFAMGGLTDAIYGVGGGAGLFGSHRLMYAAAALLFPIVASFERGFATRVRGLAAMWGIRVIAPVAVAQFIALVLFVVINPTLPSSAFEPASLEWLATWFMASYVADGVLNSGFEILIRRRDRQGKSLRHVVVFGGGQHGQRFIDALTRQENLFLKVDAFFDERAKSIPDRIGDIPFGGGGDELIAYVQRNAIDEIFIALPWSADSRILDLLRKFRPLPASVRLAPETTLLQPALGNPDTNIGTLAPVIRNTPLSPWGQFFKSIGDRVAAIAALLWLSPLMIGIAIAIKLTSRGPVFFRQDRLGFNNLPFSVYKFRTMRAVRASDDTLKQATRQDARITKIGGFLRRWSLDELPQLFNVLRGDMSLVGPRPHPMWRQASDLWEQGGSEPLDAIIHEYAARHRVKPGITGWAQISGYRGETATIDRMHKRVELDIFYIDHWSLWFDAKIVLRTFIALFQSQNAY